MPGPLALHETYPMRRYRSLQWTLGLTFGSLFGGCGWVADYEKKMAAAQARVIDPTIDK